MKELDGYFFFINGPFSNWYKSPFFIDGITFNCGEQWMMYQKAKLFGDEETAKKITMKSNPRDQKELGRQVKNYNDALWSEKRFELVKKGLKEKFLQNTPAREFLLHHSDKIIVEAASYDRIWGIGYGMDDPNLMINKDNWGLNLLGKCLNEIADEIKRNQIESIKLF